MCRASVKKELQEHPGSSGCPVFGPQVASWGLYCGHVGNFEPKFVSILLACLEEVVAWILCWFLGSLGAFKIVFSPKRKHNFDIFVKVVVGIVFDLQNLPKIDPKTVPRGSQEAPRPMSKTMCKTSVQKKCAGNSG